MDGNLVIGSGLVVWILLAVFVFSGINKAIKANLALKESYPRDVNKTKDLSSLSVDLSFLAGFGLDRSKVIMAKLFKSTSFSYDFPRDILEFATSIYKDGKGLGLEFAEIINNNRPMKENEILWFCLIENKGTSEAYSFVTVNKIL